MSLIRMLILASAALAFTAQNAAAEIKITEKVRYERESGFSDWVQTDVSFASGSELNGSNMFGYSPFNVYAIIFFSQDQAAVIDLDGVWTCGGTPTASCLTPSFGNLTGTDKGGRKWEFCSRSWC